MSTIENRTDRGGPVIDLDSLGLEPGASGDGVRSVQRYLRRFGYLGEGQGAEGGQGMEMDADAIGIDLALLDDRPEAHEGDFDDATEEALKRFQQMAGIPVTGTVDEATLARMQQKRCGVPDVGAFETGHSKWSTNELTYSFQNLTPDLSDSQVAWAIDQAFALWAAETPLRFRRVADGTTGDIVIRFVAGDHGDGAPFDDAGGTLAHAFYPSNNGAIRGDTHFDEAERWTVDIPATGTDLVTVAAHEFGHALGLGHSSVTGALMAPFYGGPSRALSGDDIAGINALYGNTGRIEHAAWVHGNSAAVEHPDRMELMRPHGFFNRLVGKPNTENWVHISIPTPVIEDGRRLAMDRFMLRATTGGGNALLRDVHIRDGDRLVAVHDGVNRSGSLGFERFGVASMPSATWGVSVSLGFTFGGGSASSRRVDLISAGMDFR